MIYLTDIATFLDRFFAVERYGDDQGGVFVPSDQPIRRIGLALEPWQGIAKQVEQRRLDGLFLHRPWKLEAGELPAGVGVVAYHLAFDEKLTLGMNTRLADTLGFTNLAMLGEKEGRPLGMVGDVAPVAFDAFTTELSAVFGGYERLIAGNAITRVAVVGAMNDALVRDAAVAGAQVYVSGQLRQPAAQAIAETGIGVVEVGHRRSELWGLRALAGVLRERWAALEVVLL